MRLYTEADRGHLYVLDIDFGDKVFMGTRTNGTKEKKNRSDSLVCIGLLPF